MMVTNNLVHVYVVQVGHDYEPSYVEFTAATYRAALSYAEALMTSDFHYDTLEIVKYTVGKKGRGSTINHWRCEYITPVLEEGETGFGYATQWTDRAAQ